VPYGSSEYDVAGWIRGKSTPVIVSDLTGLPIPSTGEIVIEGFMHPNDDRDEGPFGEWTGYYAGGRKPAPQITIERIRYRTNPILLGVLTGRPPTDDTYYRGVLRSAMIWDQLEASGIPGITGVWVHEASGGRLWVTVSVKQMYAGHSTQVAHVASQCHAGAYANRFVVVVDDDIDVTDTSDVIWAMCTRMDASEDVTTIVNAWSTGLDPMAYQRGDAWFNSRLIIDASRPWNRRETFPTVVAPSRDYRAMIVDKWASELPELRR
jgi:4-hydroxy-3-polyprenylbenzoate decarboxylase